MAQRSRNEMRIVRHQRLRKRLEGVADRPRLAVYRSLKHICAQIIDDATGTTLVAASSQEKGIEASGNRQGALAVGKLLGERAKAAGITQVVFDRGGYRYHGRVSSLAEGARQAGLEF